jgi:porphobilinogen synthase
VDNSLTGHRRTYQQDVGNSRESMRELRLDLAEGADIVMVKPAFLDIVAAVAQASDVPVAVYQVSGEYAMLEAAAAQGWIDREQTLMESITGCVRAGADIVVTYWALEAAEMLR